MCKFCDSGKKELMYFDNRDSMRTSFGQYMGVSVDAYVYLEGNMLSLNSYGNYRSDGDCYYETQGIDSDGEDSSKHEASIVKLTYCPFCGKKLAEGVYEAEDAKRHIRELAESIEICESAIERNFNVCFFYFTRQNVECGGIDDTGWTRAKPQEGDDIMCCIYGDYPDIRYTKCKDINWKYFPFMRSHIQEGAIKPFSEEEINSEFYGSSYWNGKVTYFSKYYHISDDIVLKYIKQGIVYGVDLDKKRTKMTEDKYKKIIQSREHVKSLLENFKKEKEEYANILKKYGRN